MKIVPSEFSNSAWNCFIFAKEISYENHQQDVDSDNLLLALIKQDKLTKKILKLLLRILPIQTTPWDSFSIKKYDFNHVPITNPETFKLKSYAKSLNDILRVSKLPSCNNN